MFIAGQAVLEDVEFMFNQADGVGGAIASVGDLHLREAVFHQNSASVAGGSMALFDGSYDLGGVTSAGGFAPRGGHWFLQDATVVSWGAHLDSSLVPLPRESGGGIELIGGSLRFENGAINDGSAYYGGGIWASNAEVTLVDATVRNGSTGFGGIGGSIGIVGGSLTVQDSSMRNGSAGQGGHIWASGATVTLQDATIGRGVADGEGGGVFLANSSLACVDSQFENNDADLGWAVYSAVDATTTSVDFQGCEVVAEPQDSSWTSHLHLASYAGILRIDPNAYFGEPTTDFTCDDQGCVAR